MLTANVSLEKLVDDWGEDGAAGNTRTVFYESETLTAENEADLKKQVSKFVGNLGVDLAEFIIFNEEKSGEKQFSHSRVEDNDGNEDVNGKYLADYSLYVKCFKSVQIKCPSFGLKKDY